MRLERTDDLEGLRKDTNGAIVAAEEYVIRAGADAVQIVLFATLVFCDADGIQCRNRTSKTAGLSTLSGGFTCETSKKLKAFHCPTQS